MVIGLRSSKEPPGRFLLCSIWDLRTIDRIPIGPRSDTDLSASHGIPPGIYIIITCRGWFLLANGLSSWRYSRTGWQQLTSIAYSSSWDFRGEPERWELWLIDLFLFLAGISLILLGPKFIGIFLTDPSPAVSRILTFLTSIA